MKYFKGMCLVVFCTLLFTSCKDFDNDIPQVSDSVRIKSIIKYDEAGILLNRDLFNYEDNRLVLWQTCRKDENNKLNEIQRMKIDYNGSEVIAKLSVNRNNFFVNQQSYKFQVYNNLVRKKVTSRLANPLCENCWKYEYLYNNCDLIEWRKYIKQNSNNWFLIRKGTYIYDNVSLSEYKDSVNFDNTELHLDYKKVYTFENNKITGWLGGTYINNSEWQPTQKVEYTYLHNNITRKLYSVWSNQSETWREFGTVYYKYDLNNTLIEKSSTQGERIIYEYEKGQGNAILFLTPPEEEMREEPTIKSSNIFISAESTAFLFSSLRLMQLR